MAMSRQEFLDLMDAPCVHFLATMACNLRCSYCPVTPWLLDKADDNFLSDAALNEILLEATQPCQLYVAGGEPLLSPQLPDFMNIMGAKGHRFTFDSNATHNANTVRSLLEKVDPKYVAYFDISHHLDQRVPLKTIIKFCQVLREFNVDFYVKYLARPCDKELINSNISILESEGIGTTLCVYTGADTDTVGNKRSDKVFPHDLTVQDFEWILSQVRLRQHLGPIAGGLIMKGHQCIAGHDMVVTGDLGENMPQFWPCCHKGHVEVDLEDTFFKTGRRGKKACTADYACFAGANIDMGYMAIPEETYFDLFSGPMPPLPPKVILEYIKDYLPTIAPAADKVAYEKMILAAERMANRHDSA